LKSKLKNTLKPRRKHNKTRKNQSNKKKKKNKYSKKEAYDRFKHSNPALSSSSLALGLA